MGIFTAVRSGFAQFLVGTPRFLYQAGFVDEILYPVHDPLGIGRMYTTATPGVPLPPTAMEMIAPTAELPWGSARFTIRRPEVVPTGSVALGARIPSFPPGLSVFRILATFASPSGPHEPGNSWASAVWVHAPGPQSTDRKTRITVTLQAAWNADDRLRPHAGARMNTPLPTQGAGGGEWLPQPAFEAIFPAGDPAGPPLKSVYSSELRVDRNAPRGDATLFVRTTGDGHIVEPGPGYVVGYMEHRTFVHPFMAYRDANGNENTIASAGFFIALASGNGPASVIVRDFRIFGLTGRDVMHGIRSLSWLPSGIAGMISAARRRLIDWAFEGTTAPIQPAPAHTSPR